VGVTGRALATLIVLVAGLGASATVAEASITVPAGTPATFTGAGASAASALASFEGAAGGADNGTATGEQGSGFRHITWDGIALDGSDPGSTVIKSGHVVALAPGRLQPWGVELGAQVAVAGDGFQSVNAGVAGRFTPFSAPDIWAPFNSDTTGLQIVAPGPSAGTPSPALTRGLGIVFLNVRSASTTEIQYYNDDALLGSVFAPVGSTSFAGLLFGGAVVTRVVVTLGNAEIFSFDGSTVTPGSADSGATNLVAADDVVLAEPGPARPAVGATAGVPVTPVLDTFSDTDPSTTPASYAATIDWGDGIESPGQVASGPGGTFVVTGSHTYPAAGSYTAEVTVDDFAAAESEQTSDTVIQVAARPSTTTVACSPSPVAVTADTTCTAIVADAGPGGAVVPTGRVTFSSPTPGATFDADGGCVLGPIANPGESACQVDLIPGEFPPGQARVLAAYGGDGAHIASAGTAIIGVRAERCTMRALARKLLRHPPGFAVIVNCDARANVVITAKAVAARRGKHKQVRFAFGTLRVAVSPGRPTVLVIKPSAAAKATLKGVKQHHQRITLKLTLTASSHASRTTTTTQVSSVRVS
jgi:hypothetical protein